MLICVAVTCFAALGDDLLRGHYLHQEKGVRPKDDSYSQSIMKYSNVNTYRKKERTACSFDRTTGKLKLKPQTDEISGQTQNCAFLLFRSGLSVPMCIYVVFLHVINNISYQRNHLKFKIYLFLIPDELLTIFINFYSRDPSFLTSAPIQDTHKMLRAK